MSATTPRLHATDVERLLVRHARAILDATEQGYPGEQPDTAAIRTNATALLSVLTDHGRVLSREADRIAQMAAERAGDYIADHVSEWEPDQTNPTFGDGMREVLDELEQAGLVDELAGVTPLDDACRRLRRAAGQR